MMCSVMFFCWWAGGVQCKYFFCGQYAYVAIPYCVRNDNNSTKKNCSGKPQLLIVFVMLLVAPRKIVLKSWVVRYVFRCRLFNFCIVENYFCWIIYFTSFCSESNILTNNWFCICNWVWVGCFEVYIIKINVVN